MERDECGCSSVFSSFAGEPRGEKVTMDCGEEEQGARFFVQVGALMAERIQPFAGSHKFFGSRFCTGAFQ